MKSYPKNVVIALHGSPSSNSGLHVLGLSRELDKMGFQITVCVPSLSSACNNSNWPSSIRIQTFVDYLSAENKRPPDLFHSWTPRQLLVDFYIQVCKRYNRHIPYIVHLEDNEELLVRSHMGIGLKQYEECEIGNINMDVPKHLMHPFNGREFLFYASAITALIDTLVDIIPASLPFVTFWPSYDDAVEWSVPPDESFRAKLGIDENQYITVYTGNVHAANVDEVRSLYLAVALANRRGIPLKLIRTGQDTVPLADKGIELLKRNSVDLGFVEHCELPKLLAIADILIQPGEDDAWNHYRVPSKLPEYLASGKPVIMPETNLGKLLMHSKDAIVLKKANAENIVYALETWLPQKKRLDEIGANGKLFAKKNLTWEVAAQRVFKLYHDVLVS